MPLYSLPVEIRYIIWDLVASSQERKIKLFFKSNRSKVLKASSPPPQILYICQESRRIGLCSYQKFKHVNSYINFEIDSINLPARYIPWASSLAGRTNVTYPHELKHVPSIHHDFVLSVGGNNKFSRHDMSEDISLWSRQHTRFQNVMWVFLNGRCNSISADPGEEERKAIMQAFKDWLQDSGRLWALPLAKSPGFVDDQIDDYVYGIDGPRRPPYGSRTMLR